MYKIIAMATSSSFEELLAKLLETKKSYIDLNASKCALGGKPEEGFSTLLTEPLKILIRREIELAPYSGAPKHCSGARISVIDANTKEECRLFFFTCLNPETHKKIIVVLSWETTKHKLPDHRSKLDTAYSRLEKAGYLDRATNTLKNIQPEPVIELPLLPSRPESPAKRFMAAYSAFEAALNLSTVAQTDQFQALVENLETMRRLPTSENATTYVQCLNKFGIFISNQEGRFWVSGHDLVWQQRANKSLLIPINGQILQKLLPELPKQVRLDFVLSGFERHAGMMSPEIKNIPGNLLLKGYTEFHQRSGRDLFKTVRESLIEKAGNLDQVDVRTFCISPAFAYQKMLLLGELISITKNTMYVATLLELIETNSELLDLSRIQKLQSSLSVMVETQDLIVKLGQLQKASQQQKYQQEAKKQLQKMAPQQVETNPRQTRRGQRSRKKTISSAPPTPVMLSLEEVKSEVARLAEEITVTRNGRYKKLSTIYNLICKYEQQPDSTDQGLLEIAKTTVTSVTHGEFVPLVILAGFFGYLPLIDKLIEINPEFINSPLIRDNSTLLIGACTSWQLEMITYLLGKGANPDMQTTQGETALTSLLGSIGLEGVCLRKKETQEATAHLLLDCSVKPKSLLNTYFQMSPLFLAVKLDYSLDLVERMLILKADPTQRMTIGDETAYIIDYAKTPEMENLLKKYGSPQRTSTFTRTPDTIVTIGGNPAPRTTTEHLLANPDSRGLKHAVIEAEKKKALAPIKKLTENFTYQTAREVLIQAINNNQLELFKRLVALIKNTKSPLTLTTCIFVEPNIEKSSNHLVIGYMIGLNRLSFLKFLVEEIGFSPEQEISKVVSADIPLTDMIRFAVHLKSYDSFDYLLTQKASLPNRFSEESVLDLMYLVLNTEDNRFINRLLDTDNFLATNSTVFSSLDAAKLDRFLQICMDYADNKDSRFTLFPLDNAPLFYLALMHKIESVLYWPLTRYPSQILALLQILDTTDTITTRLMDTPAVITPQLSTQKEQLTTWFETQTPEEARANLANGTFTCEPVFGVPVLHFYCMQGNIPMIKFLLDEIKADSAEKTINGEAAEQLTTWFETETPDEARANLANGTFSCEPVFGLPVLHFYCMQGNIPMIRFLLDEIEVSPAEKTINGETAVKLAGRYKQTEVVRMLLSRLYKTPKVVV